MADLPRGYYPNQSPIKSRSSPSFGYLDEHTRRYFHGVCFPLGAEYTSQVYPVLAYASSEHALIMPRQRL